MRSPRTATAPFSITRRCAAMVRTYRALQITSAGSAISAVTARRKLQKRRIEGPWKYILQTERFDLTARIHQRELDVSAELPQNLPASPARRSEHIRVGSNRNARERASAFGN